MYMCVHSVTTCCMSTQSTFHLILNHQKDTHINALERNFSFCFILIYKIGCCVLFSFILQENTHTLYNQQQKQLQQQKDSFYVK